MEHASGSCSPSGMGQPAGHGCLALLLELQGRVTASECFDDQGLGPDTVAEGLCPGHWAAAADRCALALPSFVTHFELGPLKTAVIFDDFLHCSARPALQQSVETILLLCRADFNMLLSNRRNKRSSRGILGSVWCVPICIVYPGVCCRCHSFLTTTMKSHA